LAVWGFNPFMPQFGIYCGGFQGPLYPQPTTLLIESIRDQFEPLDFRTAEPTDYTMDAYVGLSRGNPGIDWRNPGHLLGMMDTFFRMTYGLNVIKGMRDGLDNRSPIINMKIPFRNALNYKNILNKTVDDLYPEFSEIPTDYIDNLLSILDASFGTSPEGKIPEIHDDIEINNRLHVPTSSVIDFVKLFNNIHTDLYFEVIPVLRQALVDLIEQASQFEVTATVDLDSIPHRLDISEDNWPAGMGFFRTITSTSATKGLFFNSCGSLSQSSALNLINKDGLLHEAGEFDDSDAVKLEHRTLHELNAIINILPIQINGLKWSSVEDGDALGIAYNYVIFSVCDLTLNINSEIDTTININGTASLDADNVVPLGLDGENIFITHKRSFSVEYRSTNKFLWNRTWFDLNSFSQKFTDLQEEDEIVFSKTADSIVINSPLSKSNFSFNQDLNIKVGGNNIFTRLIIMSRIGVSDGGSSSNSQTTDRMILDINILDENGDLVKNKNFEIDGVIPQITL